MRRCALCRRTLREGRHVPLIGHVGSECYRRVAALDATLERLELSPYLDGVTVPATRGTDGDGWLVPRPLVEAEGRARRVGLFLRFSVDEGQEPPTVTARLERSPMPGSKALLLAALQREVRA